MMYMVQFRSDGRFIRAAKMNLALWHMWAEQLPNCPIEFVADFVFARR